MLHSLHIVAVDYFLFFLQKAPTLRSAQVGNNHFQRLLALRTSSNLLEEKGKNRSAPSLISWFTTDFTVLCMRWESSDSPLNLVGSRLPARGFFRLQAVKMKITEVSCYSWTERPASLLPQATGNKSVQERKYNLFFWYLVVIMARDKGFTVLDTVKLIPALQSPRS